ncbi:hypothetical protein L486_04778 [Kwoniella mangroviensis CBS 10435]|uniref:Uncharacterized protein n=1 Tax=Kwoniella mangroviensis CBS 10435 TaxID=1331196 RepID=A0A1B9IP29_9TREE|nr:hypothetical protein L486_04778 [Kwoniella mangroviensis CBS 10435]
MTPALCTVPDVLAINRILRSSFTYSDLLSAVNGLVSGQGYRYVTARRPTKSNPVFTIQCDHHGKKTSSSSFKSDCKHQITFKSGHSLFIQPRSFWKIDWDLTSGDPSSRNDKFIDHNHGPKSAHPVSKGKGKGKLKRRAKRKDEYETETDSDGWDEEEERYELRSETEWTTSRSSSLSSTSTPTSHRPSPPSTASTSRSQSSMQTQSSARAKAKGPNTMSGQVVIIEDYDELIGAETKSQINTSSSSSAQKSDTASNSASNISQGSSSKSPRNLICTDNNGTSTSLKDSTPTLSQDTVRPTDRVNPTHPPLSNASQSGPSSSPNDSKISTPTFTNDANHEQICEIARLREENEQLMIGIQVETTKCKEAEEVQTRLKTLFSQEERARREAQEQSRKLQSTINELKEQLKQLKDDLYAERFQKNALKSDIKELEERVTILGGRLKTEKSETAILKADYRKKEEENNLLTRKNKLLIEKMESEKGRCNDIRLQVQLNDSENLQKDLDESRAENEKLKVEYEILKIEKEAFRSKIERLEKEKKDLRTANDDIKRSHRAKKQLEELEKSQAERSRKRQEEQKKRAEEELKRKRADEMEEEEAERTKRKLLEDIRKGEDRCKE